MSNQPLPSQADFVIIGAGIIGSALAAELSKKKPGSIVVVDPDLEGSLSSSELNAGGVRATFHQEINVLASKLTIEYFEKFKDEVGYRPCGYLWLLDQNPKNKMIGAQEKWKNLGWETEAWDVRQLTEKRPFIDMTDDLSGALFSPRDGLVNTNLLKLHFRNVAKKNGVQFFDRRFFKASSGMDLEFEVHEQNLSAEEKKDVLTLRASSTKKETIRAAKVVNCAGAWAGEVAKRLGYKTQSKAVRRQISFFDCRKTDLSPYGMIIDTSGVYFHPEATSILGGRALRQEKSGFNFHYDGEAFFEEHIWMPLSQRSSAFAELKHLNGWAGMYEISPDESAIVGSVDDRIYESHSYSGHGVMHSYAAGLALAELLTVGKYETLDFDCLTGSRFASGKRVSETAVI